MPSEWLIEPLDRKRHERKSFDCGNDELNNWLVQFAGQYEERDLARTYVATLAGDSRVVGYYSVCSHHVQFASLPQTEAKGLPKNQHVPVVLLGKLAVCKSVICAFGRRSGPSFYGDALHSKTESAALGGKLIARPSSDIKSPSQHPTFNPSES